MDRVSPDPNNSVLSPYLPEGSQEANAKEEAKRKTNEVAIQTVVHRRESYCPCTGHRPKSPDSDSN